MKFFMMSTSHNKARPTERATTMQCSAVQCTPCCFHSIVLAPADFRANCASGASARCWGKCSPARLKCPRSRRAAIAFCALCGMPPALRCDGTRDELLMELQRRGTVSAKISASKDVLKVTLSMSIENEELKQELALAQKRPASPEAQSSPSKRAAACASAGGAESSSSSSAHASRDTLAAASAPSR